LAVRGQFVGVAFGDLGKEVNDGLRIFVRPALLARFHGDVVRVIGSFNVEASLSLHFLNMLVRIAPIPIPQFLSHLCERVRKGCVYLGSMIKRCDAEYPSTTWRLYA
jgi:hypothetical protein